MSSLSAAGTSTGTGHAGRSRRDRAGRRRTLVPALLVPVMIASGFAMVAILPVALVVRGVLKDDRLRRLRPWAGVLAVAYLVPLALWAVHPDRAPSLTKDMHPAFAVGIIAAALAYVAAYVAEARRR
ncbi:hypothetical protein ACHAAC_03925 [Aeromicrobium sp. CF4.19]|uniref:hypothetical protein n=1 Tax=Aeromicrobium sp. CF4.19 TaxID=3373082 RepID=UPI003EE55BDF